MIVYQIVSTQVSRQLPQFATLKAIGYPDRSLAGTVSAMSLLIVIAGFIPALGAALGLYSVIRQETLLPVTMSEMRLLAVFAAALAMALISALLSVWHSAPRRACGRVLRGPRLSATSAPRRHPPAALAGMAQPGSVPLAWRNLVSNKRGCCARPAASASRCC